MGMLPILTMIMQVLSTGMLPILTNMMEAVLGQFNPAFVKDERDLQMDDSDDGLVALKDVVLQVKLWLGTVSGVKCIFGVKVVTKLE